MLIDINKNVILLIIETGPLAEAQFRSIVISASTVLGLVSIVVAVGALYGFFKILCTMIPNSLKKQNRNKYPDNPHANLI